MKKLVLTFDVLNGIDDQTAVSHGFTLAQAVIDAMDVNVVNPFVGIEVKDERRTRAVEVS